MGATHGGSSTTFTIRRRVSLILTLRQLYSEKIELYSPETAMSVGYDSFGSSYEGLQLTC